MHAEQIAILAVILIGVGIISEFVRDRWVTAPMVLVIVGLLLGPLGIEVLHPPISDGGLSLLLELTLVMVLFTDGYYVCTRCPTGEKTVLWRLLGPGIALSVTLGTVAAYFIFPELSLFEGALMGALLTPTDAALGRVAICDPKLPKQIRDEISIESGFNDGLMVPVIVFLIACQSVSAGQEPIGYWIAFILKQIGLGLLLGGVLGFFGGRLLDVGCRFSKMEAGPQQIIGMGLALAAYGMAELMGGNGLISVFMAGIVLGQHPSVPRNQAHDFASGQSELLGAVTFLLFAVVLLPSALLQATPAMWIMGLLAIFFIRVFSVSVSLLGSGRGLSEVAFLAWMGPRGVASLLFAVMVLRSPVVVHGELLFQLVCITVFLSIFVYGATAPLVGRWMGTGQA